MNNDRNILDYLEKAFWIGFITSTTGATARFIFINSLFWLAVDLFTATQLIFGGLDYSKLFRCAFPFLLCAGWALLSTTWSIEPGVTIYTSVQLIFTIIAGFLFGSRTTLVEIRNAIFFAELIAVGLSVIIIALNIDIYGDGSNMMRGLFPHKNILAINVALLFIVSASLIEKSSWRWVSLPAIFGCPILVLASSSGTSSICILASGLLFAIFIVLEKISSAFILVTASLTAFLILLWSAAIDFGNESVIDFAFNALGKDKGMTGRTILWAYGWQSFSENLLLGVGYDAYVPSAHSNFGLAQYASSQQLPYLHNNYLQVGVDLGIIGFAIFIIALLSSLAVVLFYSIQTSGIESKWPLCYVVAILIYAFAENPLYYNHSIFQFLIVAVVTAVFQANKTNLNAR